MTLASTPARPVHRLSPAPAAALAAAALVAAVLATSGCGPAGSADDEASLRAAPGSAPAAGEAGDLGRVEFPTSATGEAQARFLRGVLLLHSFEYGDAREQFVAAREADPGFAMAYWGEALTHDHPLWHEQDRAGARAALERLAPTAEARRAKAPTDREKAYLEAVEVLFGEGEEAARYTAYAEAMGRVSERFPDDPEAKVLHALATLATARGGRDHATYMRAAGLAEQVYRDNPRHPGAVHYLIHSYDDPVHAPLGLRPARAYAEIAPAAVHAQHMPSHIFLALGMWDDVIAANRASADAAREGGGVSYHALHWLMYGLLQQGRVADARRVLGEMEESVRESPNEGARYYLARARANFIVEARRAEGDVVDMAVDVDGVRAAGSTADAFATGYAAAARGAAGAAEAALARLRSLREAAAADPDAYRPAVDGAGVMELELEALVARLRGNPEAAVARLEEAAAAEEAMVYEYGPPVVPKPAEELLGEVLLEEGRAAEARDRFAAALERAPRRALAMLGRSRAAGATGDAEAARVAYAELAALWARADEGLDGLAEARAVARGTAGDAGGGAP